MINNVVTYIKHENKKEIGFNYTEVMQLEYSRRLSH